MSSAVMEADLSAVPTSRLKSMSQAAEKILEIYQELHDAETNIVFELLGDSQAPYEWQHYPQGDALDQQSHSQYYYHSHPPGDRTGPLANEHGHFHLFLRQQGIPPGIEPKPISEGPASRGEDADACHLIGISMSRAGFPMGLFTVNRWVTGETWYRADHVMSMLDCFGFRSGQSRELVGDWLTAMVTFFYPIIEVLVRARDARIAQWASERPGENVYEDRLLEILSATDIDMMRHIGALCRELMRRGEKTALVASLQDIYAGN